MNTNKSYPVFYLNDGQNLFVKSTAPNGEWHIDETMNKLTEDDIVEEMIIVGIYNTSERIREYTPYNEDEILKGERSLAKEYSKFIIEDLIPYIDSKYRTVADRENRAIGGSSCGGTFSMWFIQNYSEYFSMAGVMSANLGTGEGKLLKLIENEDKKDIKIVLDIGEYEWSRAKPVLDLFEKKGYVYGKDIIFYEENGGAHTEESWAERIKNHFIMFKGKRGFEAGKMEIYVEDVNGWYAETLHGNWEKGEYKFINTVLTLKNGLRYSLNKYADYEVIDNNIIISEDGVLKFYKSGDKLKVKYSKFEEEVNIY